MFGDFCEYTLTSYQMFTSSYKTTIIIFASFDVKLLILKEGVRYNWRSVLKLSM